MKTRFPFINQGALVAAASLLAAANAFANSCPASHPLQCGGACYVDEAQARSGGCNVGSGSSNPAPANPAPSNPAPSNPAPSNPAPAAGNGSCQSASNPSHVVSGRRTEFTQPWCDTVCVTYIGNGTACINAAGTVVTNASVCSDPSHAVEAIKDIEYNLGIEIDDQFQAQVGYQGAVPSINPRISVEDAITYFSALIGDQKGRELVGILNTNNDGWIHRNEASMAKGADPRQVLNTGFGCGLSTDDIMAYVGLYMGDGAIDKYAGDLDQSIKDRMLEFTRSWQPGVNAQACKYRGGCNGSSNPPATNPPATNPVNPPATNPVNPPAPTPPATNPGSGNASGVFGLEFVSNDSAVLYHEDNGWTGSFAYLCIDNNCQTATRTGDRFERSVSGLSAGNTYTVEFKVQDNSTGQCLSGQQSVTYQSGGATTTSNCD